MKLMTPRPPATTLPAPAWGACLTTLLVLLALTHTTPVQAEDALANIKETNRITLGVRESSGALSYSIGSYYAGYQIEICKQIVLSIQKQLSSPNLEIRYQAVTAQNRIPLLVKKTIDLECGSTANTLARQRDVAFSYTTFVEETRIAVKKATGINDITELVGKRVVTTTGTTSVQNVRRYAKTRA
jgi:glutamate/aspartate transport system substrate-binding protein